MRRVDPSRIYAWDVTRAYVWLDSFIRGTCRGLTCDITPSSPDSSTVQQNGPILHSCVRRDSSTRVTRLFICENDSCIRVTWSIQIQIFQRKSRMKPFRIHTWDMTYLYLWHDLFSRVTWRFHTCDMTPLSPDYVYFWCDLSKSGFFNGTAPAFIRERDSSIRVTWLVHTWDMTHTHVCPDSSIASFVKGTAE